MAKGYNIDLNDYTFLLDLLKSHNDGSSLINKDIITLEFFIKRVSNNFRATATAEVIDPLENAFDDIETIHASRKFISIIQRFYRKNSPIVGYTPRYRSILIPDHKAVEIAHDFFRDQDETLYSNFLDLEDSFEDHLKFIRPNKNTSGETFIVKTTGDAFMYVPNYNNICKVTILIHEIEHVLDVMENMDFWDYSSIREIVSVFVELVATDYVARYLHLPNEGNKRKAEIHQIILSDCRLLLDKVVMLDSLKGKTIRSEGDLYDALNKNGYSKEAVNQILYTPADGLLTYQLPQYVAIELFNIYKRNKAKAFKIIFDIVKFGNDSNIYDILNTYGINLGSNFRGYEDQLCKSLRIKGRC